ncbi:MAG: hypothetical protein AAF582_05515 [Pseudomonadota bacterium]
MSKFDYTAIIYFHGIGTQRRYEEMSRLIDAFDQFSLLHDQKEVGILRDQKLQMEPHVRGDQSDGNDFFSFLQFKRFIRPNPRISARERPIPVDTFRMYEGYWSDVVAAGLDAPRVLFWVYSKVIAPIRCLNAPWRDHQRLKLSYLFRTQRDDPQGGFKEPIEEDPDGKRVGEHKTAYEQIADAYHLFESWPAQRTYPKGAFSDFLAFLKHGVPDWALGTETPPDAQIKGDGQSLLLRGWGAARADKGRLLTKLAKRWRRRFIWSQRLILLRLISIVLGTLGALTFLLFLISDLAIAKMLSLPAGEGLLEVLPSTPGLTVGIISAIVIVPLYFMVLKALKFFVGDVVFWTAQEGRSDLFDKRAEILERAVSAIDHVCADPKCKRVVIVGHSLGASVGYEALIETARRREAIEVEVRRGGHPQAHDKFRHEKISHFFTLGSPIELIHYFFDLISSKYHRYNRIVADLQRSARKPPFQKGRKRWIKWINITSKADPISHDVATQSELRSPWIDDFYAAPGRPAKRHQKAIEEIEIVGHRAPLPGTAHSSYFAAPEAVGRMFQAAILNDGELAQREDDPVTDQVRKIARRAVFVRDAMAMFACWTLAVAAIAFWARMPEIAGYGLGGFLAAIAVIALHASWLVDRDEKRPLTLQAEIDKTISPEA